MMKILAGMGIAVLIFFAAWLSCVIDELIDKHVH